MALSRSVLADVLTPREHGLTTMMVLLNTFVQVCPLDLLPLAVPDAVSLNIGGVTACHLRAFSSAGS